MRELDRTEICLTLVGATCLVAATVGLTATEGAEREAMAAQLVMGVSERDCDCD